MDLIKNVLNDARFTKPDEIAAIKSYVRRKYKMDVEVLVRAQDLVIITGSAGLANSLRLELPRLQEAAGTDKKLIFRI
jgi:hypothetical protein